VHEHGLYEWNILEPALGEIICPLRFNASGVEEEARWSGGLSRPCWHPARRSVSRWRFPASSRSPSD